MTSSSSTNTIPKASVEVSSPLSNESLLAISCAGLIIVATSLYLMFFRGTRSIQPSSGTTQVQESRAQRRSREREERRRLAAQLNQQDDDDNVEANARIMDEDEMRELGDVDDGDYSEDNDEEESHQHSAAGRKSSQRRKDQKKAEKRARKEEMRRMQQVHREEMEQKRAAEEEAYNQWLSMKRLDEQREREEFEKNRSIKEEELHRKRVQDVNSIYEPFSAKAASSIAMYVMQHKSVSLQDIFMMFRIRHSDITNRVSDLGRYAENGVFILNQGNIIYFDEEQLGHAYQLIQKYGRISYAELDERLISN